MTSVTNSIRLAYTDRSALPAPRLELTPSARFVLHQAKKRLAGQCSDNSEESFANIVSSVENEECEPLSERERAATISALRQSAEDFDILTPLVENTDVNDIIVAAFDDISIQHRRRNTQTSLTFPDSASYKAFIETLLKRVGKSCTLATPVIDTALSPSVRLCVTHESFSPAGSGPTLTLRLSRHQDTSIESLALLEFAPREVLFYLSQMVRSGEATVLIAGEVGTGKTTLVKALAREIPDDEAILIIEDTQEIVMARNFVRTLLTREANTEGVGRITPAQAIRTGMRMAMNRVILGEIRDSEAAEAFIDVCASGHCGLSTIHSRNARDALGRLELFLARAQGSLGTDVLRRQISNAISVVVYLGVDCNSGNRRVLDVVELASTGEGIIQLSPIFSYAKGRWTRGSGISRYDCGAAAIRATYPGQEISL